MATAGLRIQEVGCKVGLATVLLASRAAHAQDAAVPSLSNNGQTDGAITRDTVLLAAFLILLVGGLVAAVFIVRKRHQQQEKLQQEKQNDAEVKEWLYRDHGMHGPFSNTQMRSFWVAGLINRSTEVKLVWWQRDFTKVSELFPESGTEFTRPAKMDEEEVRNSNWHRFSILSQPTGPAVPDLHWYYLSPDGKEEGPFESGKMRHWFTLGYFMENQRVRYEGQQDDDGEKWKYLKDLFTDLPEAFNTLPNGCSPAWARKSMMARHSVAPMGRQSVAMGRKSMKSTAPRPSVVGNRGISVEMAEMGKKASGVVPGLNNAELYTPKASKENAAPEEPNGTCPSRSLRESASAVKEQSHLASVVEGAGEGGDPEAAPEGDGNAKAAPKVSLTSTPLPPKAAELD